MVNYEMLENVMRPERIKHMHQWQMNFLIIIKHNSFTVILLKLSY